MKISKLPSTYPSYVRSTYELLQLLTENQVRERDVSALHMMYRGCYSLCAYFNEETSGPYRMMTPKTTRTLQKVWSVLDKECSVLSEKFGHECFPYSVLEIGKETYLEEMRAFLLFARLEILSDVVYIAGQGII